MKKLKLKEKLYTLLDNEDYEILKNIRWEVRTTKEGKLHIRHAKTGAFIHRIIMGVPKGKLETIVDHIDGNRLDNRKKNLRICSTQENSRNRKLNKNNTSGYKGVSLTENGKWCASIAVNNKSYRLGRYNTKEEAARAYNKAAKIYHGEFARLNIIRRVKK